MRGTCVQPAAAYENETSLELCRAWLQCDRPEKWIDRRCLDLTSNQVKGTWMTVI